MIVNGTVRYGIPVVIGIPKIILRVDLPAGARVRYKFRPMCVAKALVQRGNVETEHVVIDRGTHWELSPSDWTVTTR